MAQCYIACGPRIIGFADTSYNRHETEIPVLPRALHVLQHVILCLQNAYELAPLFFIRYARSCSICGITPCTYFWIPPFGVRWGVYSRCHDGNYEHLSDGYNDHRHGYCCGMGEK